MSTTKISLWEKQFWKTYTIDDEKIKHKQESTRSKLAIGFSIWFFIIVLVYIIYLMFWNPDQNKVNLLNIILSSTTWFVWTILWFYFWQQSKE